jgi:hypothetical protein
MRHTTNRAEGRFSPLTMAALVYWAIEVSISIIPAACYKNPSPALPVACSLCLQLKAVPQAGVL